MHIAARRAVAGDDPAVAELRRLHSEELATRRGGALLASVGRSHGRGSEGDELHAVATLDGVVIGYLDAVSLRLEDSSVLCELDDLYVEKGAREVGAGAALLELLVAWASEQGAEGLDATVLPGAREAKNFFESAGFVARLITMHRRVPERSS